ncbi:MAG: hypothetical protein QOD03_1481, partial [Verrucomicrobiota bacterium]
VPEAAAALAAAAREGAGNMRGQNFIDHLRHDEIVAAIRDAEQQTSGEIRVFISHKLTDNPIAAAQKEFERLGMVKTHERNGVLIFVAPRAHKFAVIGDAGIHEKCGDRFWKELAETMTGHFLKSEFTPGIVHAIKRAGKLLAEHFPRQAGDKNELSDEVESD